MTYKGEEGDSVDVDKNTVTRYVRLAGTHADRIHHELVASAPGN